MTKNNYVYRYSKNPQFSFELPYFKNWTLSPRSETTIGYLPDDSLNTKFEIPPNVAVLMMLDPSKMRAPKLEKQGKNPNDVLFKKYFIDGFAREALRFEKDKKVIFVLCVDDLSKYGLDGKLVEDTIIKTFKFD